MSMEMNKAPVEQAVGDERAAFEQWLEQHMSHHFSPELDLAKYEDSGEYRYNPAADYWKAWQARAALASTPVADESPMAKMADALREKARQEQQAYQDRRNQATEWGPMPEGTEADRLISTAPVAHVAGDETSRYLEWAKDRSAWEMPVGTPVYYAALAQPSQAPELERPEVVARVVHSNPVVLGQCGPLNANDELMTVAQHAASVARWAEMFNRVEQQRDAALARVAELEKQEPVAHLRASDLERLNQPGIAGSAGSLWNGPREGFVPLYAAPVAQAQPEETPGEILAAKLIETWVTKHGKPAPWSTAVEITALATNMPNDERDRLLALDDDVDAQAQHSVPEGWMLVECGIWTQEQVDEMQKTVARFRNSEFVDDRALAMAVADAGQCKAPEISLAELLAAATGKEAV